MSPLCCCWHNDTTLRDGLVAVEVGFEPTEELPPHTLSRRARSATTRLHRRLAYRLAGVAVPVSGEELAQQRRRPLLEDAGDDLGPMVEPPVPYDVPE